MKNYTITVNGNTYNVTVEEGAGAVAPAAPVKSAPVAVAAPAAATQKATGAGSIKVNSPMPGKILSVKASVGQSVNKGDVIMVLEAMKMENEIVAPEDGSIASIDVNAGDSVEAGSVLATLE